MQSEVLFDLYSELHGVFSSADSNMSCIANLKERIRAAERAVGVSSTFKFVDKEREAIEYNIPTDNLRSVDIPVFLFETHRPVFSKVYLQKGPLGGYWSNVRLEMKPHKTEDHARAVFGKLLYDLVSASGSETMTRNLGELKAVVAKQKEELGFPKEELGKPPRAATTGKEKETGKTKPPFKEFAFENTRMEGTWIEKTPDAIKVRLGNAPIPSPLAQALMPLRFARLTWAERIPEYFDKHGIPVPWPIVLSYQEDLFEKQTIINESLTKIEDNLLLVYGGNVEKARRFVHTVNAEIEGLWLNIEQHVSMVEKSIASEIDVSKFYMHIRSLVTHALECIWKEFDLEGIAKNLGAEITEEDKMQGGCEAKLLYLVHSLSHNHKGKIIEEVVSFMREYHKATASLSQSDQNKKNRYFVDRIQENIKTTSAAMRKAIDIENKIKSVMGLRGDEQAKMKTMVFDLFYQRRESSALFILHKIKPELLRVLFLAFGDTPFYRDIEKDYELLEDEYRKSKSDAMEIGLPIRGGNVIILMILVVLIIIVYFKEADTVPYDSERIADIYKDTSKINGDDLAGDRKKEWLEVIGSGIVGAGLSALWFGVGLSAVVANTATGLIFSGVANLYSEYKKPDREASILELGTSKAKEVIKIAERIEKLPFEAEKDYSVEVRLRHSEFMRTVRTMLTPVLNRYSSVEQIGGLSGETTVRNVALSYEMLPHFNVEYQKIIIDLIDTNSVISSGDYETHRKRLIDIVKYDIQAYFPRNPDTEEAFLGVPLLQEPMSSILISDFSENIVNEALLPFTWSTPADYWRGWDTFKQGIDKHGYYRGFRPMLTVNAPYQNTTTDIVSVKFPESFPRMTVDESLAVLLGTSYYKHITESLHITVPLERRIVETNVALHAVTHNHAIYPVSKYFSNNHLNAIYDLSTYALGNTFIGIRTLANPTSTVTGAIRNFKYAPLVDFGESALLQFMNETEKFSNQTHAVEADIKNITATSPDDSIDSGAALALAIEIPMSWLYIITDPRAVVAHSSSLIFLAAGLASIAGTCSMLSTYIRQIIPENEPPEGGSTGKYAEARFILDKLVKSEFKEEKKKLKKAAKGYGCFSTIWASFVKKSSRIARASAKGIARSSWIFFNSLIYIAVPLFFDAHYMTRFLTSRLLVYGAGSGVMSLMTSKMTNPEGLFGTMTPFKREAIKMLGQYANVFALSLSGGSYTELIMLLIAMAGNFGMLVNKYGARSETYDTVGKSAFRKLLDSQNAKYIFVKLMSIASPREWVSTLVGNENTFARPEQWFASTTMTRIIARTYNESVDIFPSGKEGGFLNFLLEAPSEKRTGKLKEYQGIWDAKTKTFTVKAQRDLMRLYGVTALALLVKYIDGGDIFYNIIKGLAMVPQDTPVQRATINELQVLYGEIPKEYVAFTRITEKD